MQLVSRKVEVNALPSFIAVARHLSQPVKFLAHPRKAPNSVMHIPVRVCRPGFRSEVSFHHHQQFSASAILPWTSRFSFSG